jgi:RNA polymerase sigma factor (sigma-70 family)
MDYEQLDLIARKAVARLRKRLPPGVTRQDAYQEACAEALRWADVDPPPGVPREAFLVMKAWGTLADRYAREFQKQSLHRGDGPGLFTNRDNLDETGEDPVPLNPVRPEARPHPDVADIQVDVRAAVAMLPEPHRSLMLLLLEGLDHAAIAARVGMSRSWVSRRLAQARTKLSALLEDYS